MQNHLPDQLRGDQGASPDHESDPPQRASSLLAAGKARALPGRSSLCQRCPWDGPDSAISRSQGAVGSRAAPTTSPKAPERALTAVVAGRPRLASRPEVASAFDARAPSRRHPGSRCRERPAAAWKSRRARTWRSRGSGQPPPVPSYSGAFSVLEAVFARARQTAGGVSTVH